MGSASISRLRNTFRSADNAAHVDVASLLVTVLLTAGLFRGWSQGSLSAPVNVFSLKILEPTLPWLHSVGWGWLLLAGWLLALAGSVIVRGRYRAPTLLAAGILTLTTAVGFAVLTATAGGAQLAALASDRADLKVLSKTMGYTVPRPDTTVLGPFEISSSGSLVLSSLRLGFFLTLISGLLLLWRARVAGATARSLAREADTASRVRSGTRFGRWIALLSLLPAVIVVWGVLAATLASAQLSRAVTRAEAGNYSGAVSRLNSASWLNSATLAEPGDANRAGAIRLAAGHPDNAEAQLALSRQQNAAGHGLDALKILATACDRWPHDPALRAELVSQSVAYVQAHDDPAEVRALIPTSANTPLLQLVLAKFELDAGDNPNALLDGRAAERGSKDPDLKSAAVTLQSIALSRSGDDVGGRSALLTAISLDSDYVNVMARSLATGLYTSVQP